MGLFTRLRNRRKLDKLTREEVVSAILATGNQEEQLFAEMDQKGKEIDKLMEKGRTESRRETKLIYAKRIQMLKEELKAVSRRIFFLMYNTQLLERLKAAIDDKGFLANCGGKRLTDMMSDPEALMGFLNSIANQKTATEEKLVRTDDIFKQVQQDYESRMSSQIYGVQEEDDELLAMFEQQAAVEDESPTPKGDKKKDGDTSAS